MCFMRSTESLKFALRDAGRVRGCLLSLSLDSVTLGACGVGIGCVATWGLTCEECLPVWSCVLCVMMLVLGVD